MTDVVPFRALRYDPARADLARVLAPPYDVVTPAERERYWSRDPHSAIRLELTRDPAEEAATDYADAAERLRAWRRDGVLRRDAAPSLYLLRQRFADPSGRELRRIGFFASLRLEDYERRVVLPHERTLRGPKADRLRLMRASAANLSAIFLLYEDPDAELGPRLEAAFGAGEVASAKDDAGVEHSLAVASDPALAAAVARFLAPRPVVIADGHHRYETALAYRDERRAAAGGGTDAGPAERTLAYFANAYAPGTLLLPIHRVVRAAPAPADPDWRARLPRWEERRVAVSSAEALPAALERELAPLADRHAFAADDGTGTLRVFSRPADGELGVRVLHRDVLLGVFGLDDDAVREGAVGFPKSTLETARSVRAGEGSVALYLNPLRPEDVFRVTRAGEILPQKSTFFYPKLPTGLVFRPLDEPDA
ncbi:MAG TPA: DUF1015 domain-containing protein [Myxococcota bacterium]|nr:DUF1015 domain-containing protein [Myxococcota bacterium]